jgi:hypothetical protein
MNIIHRPDGKVALDFGPPAGPWITLTAGQWADLLATIKLEKR